jgi:hypothetical protein
METFIGCHRFKRARISINPLFWGTVSCNSEAALSGKLQNPKIALEAKALGHRHLTPPEPLIFIHRILHIPPRSFLSILSPFGLSAMHFQLVLFAIFSTLAPQVDASHCKPKPVNLDLRHCSSHAVPFCQSYLSVSTVTEIVTTTIASEFGPSAFVYFFANHDPLE